MSAILFEDYLDPVYNDNDDNYEQAKISRIDQGSKEYKDYFPKKTVPQVLAALDVNAAKTYNACLQDGTEKINKIRIVIVGKKESGKSLLARRLLKKTNASVEKANAMEIHSLNCKARVEDGKWIFLDEYEYETNINERILAACCQNKIIIQSEAIYKEKENKKDKSFKGKNRASTYDNNSNVHVVKSLSSDSIDSEPENKYLDLSDIVNVDMTGEDTVLIEIWDLPGDEEICSAYLSLFGKNAVYIVTVNVTENMQDNDDCGLIFWPEFIRCMNKTHSPEDDDLSVFIVGTFKDKFDGQDEICVSQMKCRMQDSTESRQHIKGYYVVSNVKELGDLDPLRCEIIMSSKKQTNWNFQTPLRWIQLDKHLHQQRQLNIPVVSKVEVNNVMDEMFIPFKNAKELEQFLFHHHDNGTLVYLKCNPDHVILNPQWLANAMMLIISSAKSKTDTRKTKEWRNLQEYGKLSQDLIEEIFSRQSPDIVKYKNLIINSMIKCYTIIRIWCSVHD
ncbi:uncharacterized protein LOC134692377 [Mytilus trossulus]|uniref:uncharacterized protein LOC134692377 n=1 Tax=Mytilus trossulus TaxID=6551 RepID=UPI003005CD1B